MTSKYVADDTLAGGGSLDMLEEPRNYDIN